MSEEKNLPELSVIVESNGDWLNASKGTLCLVVAVGDDGAESYAYGAVNVRDAYAAIHSAALQIGAIADKAGIGADAVKAVCCDCIAKQMVESRAERAIGRIDKILDGIEWECGDCPDFEAKEPSES